MEPGLGLTEAPCIIYNLNGYYEDLKNLLHHMMQMGLAFEEKLRGIYFVSSLLEIERIISRFEHG